MRGKDDLEAAWLLLSQKLMASSPGWCGKRLMCTASTPWALMGELRTSALPAGAHGQLSLSSANVCGGCLCKRMPIASLHSVPGAKRDITSAFPRIARSRSS